MIAVFTPFFTVLGSNHVFIFIFILFLFFNLFLQGFLGCSGPLDNARTIPEWLKNNLKKYAQKLKIVYHFISK